MGRKSKIQQDIMLIMDTTMNDNYTLHMHLTFNENWLK